MEITQTKMFTYSVCEQHSMTFQDKSAYDNHKSECEKLLSKKNTCVFVNEKGEGCGKNYNETSNLILHYFLVHKKYACSRCYGVYDTEKELEDHSHNDSINLRIRKK